MNWAKFLSDHGKATAQLEQVRADIRDMRIKMDAMAKAQVASQVETKVLVGSLRGAYKTIAITATVVGAIATLAARWWVATHSGG